MIGPSMEQAKRARRAVKELVWSHPAVHTVGIRVAPTAELYVHVGLHPGMGSPECPDRIEGVPVAGGVHPLREGSGR